MSTCAPATCVCTCVPLSVCTRACLMCLCVHTHWCMLQVWCCVCLCGHTHVHIQATGFWDAVEPQARGRGQEEQGGSPASSPVSLTLAATLAPSRAVSMILRGLPSPHFSDGQTWVPVPLALQLLGAGWARSTAPSSVEAAGPCTLYRANIQAASWSCCRSQA